MWIEIELPFALQTKFCWFAARDLPNADRLIRVIAAEHGYEFDNTKVLVGVTGVIFSW